MFLFFIIAIIISYHSYDFCSSKLKKEKEKKDEAE